MISRCDVSHPPNPACAETHAFPKLTRPAQRHSFPPFPSDVRFAQASTAHIKWSFQASLLPSRDGTHFVPTAPLDGPSKLATDLLRDKADWPLTARTFFTRPTLRTPGRALCPASTALYMLLPSSFVLSPEQGWFDLLLRAWTSHLIVFQSLLVPCRKEQPGSVQTRGRFNASSKLALFLLMEW